MALISRPILALGVGWLVWCGGTVSCLGQADHLPPGTPPGLPSSGMLQTPAAPAAIDTAMAILEFPDSKTAPVAIHTVQDTVLFGDVFHLILEFPGEPEGPTEKYPEAGLSAGEDWLVFVPMEKPGFLDRVLGRDANPLPDTSALPEAGDRTRVIQSFRVYRTNPFRLKVGSFESPVIQVRTRVSGIEEVAGIRTPRSEGWSPLAAVGLLLGLILVLWLVWWLWDRRSIGEDLKDRDLPPPAWLAAAIELRDLLHGGLLSRGDSRAFLDGLAGITRRFVGGRYRIAAQEMTGREIIAACIDLGHRSTQPGTLARMIDAVDHHRYNPEASGAGWCRDQAILLYDQMAEVRILPRYSEVSPDLRRQGEMAWSDLKRELASGPGRLRNSGSLSSDRGT